MQKWHYRRVSALRLIPEELILFLLWCLICLLILLVFNAYDAAFLITFASITGVYALVAALYLPFLRYRTSYALLGRQLRYRTGVFFQKDEIINRDQIIYVTLVTNPFSPLFNIANVVIKAPAATIRIRGLRTREAKLLVSRLSSEYKV